MKTRSIAIEEHYAADLAPVVVNREEIRQILINLILNAEHAMLRAHSGGRLIVRTGSQEGAVFAEIADDGPGVPPALEGQIFEPFFTTKGVGEGTGLGLPISLGIAEAHGGSLRLVPSESGACFRLTLPTPGAAGATRPAAPGPPRAAEEGGRRALVVDDEAPVRELLTQLLMLRGFGVDEAENGRAASALIELHRYDIILCDVRMPRMGGLMLYERIRADRPHLLRGFAFLGGEATDDQVDGGTKPMDAPMLSRPFTIAALDDLLRQLGMGNGSDTLARGQREEAAAR
jgi:CheY-like chemotaxis protein